MTNSNAAAQTLPEHARAFCPGKAINGRCAGTISKMEPAATPVCYRCAMAGLSGRFGPAR